MIDQAFVVTDNPEQSRYELVVEGRVVGFCSYRDTGDVVLLPHAEVDPEVEGRGYGTELARGTLDALREQGRHVVPLCPFVVDFIRKNPDYADMVEA